MAQSLQEIVLGSDAKPSPPPTPEPAKGKAAGTDDKHDEKPDEKKGEPAKPAKDDRDKEIERLRAQVREKEESERYWFEKARGAAPAEKPKEAEDKDEEFAGGEKTLEILASSGMKALVEQGFVTRRQLSKMVREAVQASLAEEVPGLIEKRIGAERASLTKEAQLLQEFPFLGNAKSNEYAETQARYQDLIADEPELKETAAGRRSLLRLAASEIAAKYRSNGKSASDREDRIRRQAGDVGGGRDSGLEFDTLSSEEERLIGAFGLDPAKYREKRAAAGRAR